MMNDVVGVCQPSITPLTVISYHFMRQLGQPPTPPTTVVVGGLATDGDFKCDQTIGRIFRQDKREVLFDCERPI